MASRRSPPEITRWMLEARTKDASQTLTRTDHEQASLDGPSTPHGSLAGGPGANRRYNHPSSNEDLSTPSSVSNPRRGKRHRTRRRNNPASQTSVASTGNTEAQDADQRNRTQVNVDER
ncbi:hypothetical protein MSAN_01828100 [Mycena sanguinolenta]|uniref:Uncharacterized protein n=1 Tax=Mycena sanguinolenta TaxID=230812 RepID=A0A8H6XRT2_9AGAR|nr:hypothetical protein MSAN_01828100 [Mycena sanguinolenta]